LAGQKECRIEEGHMMADHVRMLLSIPPKHAVSSVVGYLKGKSAIHVARHFLKRERNYAGQRLWARGFFVDTVGRKEEVIRRYIREQESEDRRLDQLELPTDSKGHARCLLTEYAGTLDQRGRRCQRFLTTTSMTPV
jgi:putative transposase